jgi:5-methylcytosine-specific restriction endonuclease McrA
MRGTARLALALALAGAAAVPASLVAQTQVVQCARCHANRDFLLGKGATWLPDTALYVPPSTFAGTAHAGLSCAACHRGFEAGYPHRVKVKVVPCETCHEQEGREWSASSHAANARVQGDAPSCVACHGSHLVFGAKDPRSPINRFNIAALCGRCHGDRRIIGKYFATPANAPGSTAAVEFPKSVHGAALTRDGLVVSATCTDCHRAHRVLPADSASSSVNRANIAATCGTCHQGVARVFAASAHGTERPAGAPDSGAWRRPVCNDCHSAHAIVRADQPQWQLGVVEECGTCHAQLYKAFLETYHGKVTRLGFGLAAKCSDCHTAHNMRPASDPQSSVFAGNLATTCRRCHPGAGASFAKYYAHPDPRARTRFPVLYWPWLFMTALLVGVMGFFAVHTGLWLLRSGVARARHEDHTAEHDTTREQ